jgi:bifunctional polynucleotide phosphatase/kinase
MSTRQVKKRTTEAPSAPNFFAKRVKDTALGVWKEEGDGSLLYFTTPSAPASSKVAAFDLDGTLINVDGPHVHPKGRHDWKFFTPDIPARLKTLHDQGYKIVIISNQAGLKRPKTGASNPRKPEWKGKIEDIVREVGIISL